MKQNRFLLGALIAGLVGTHTNIALAQPATPNTTVTIAPMTTDWKVAFAQGSAAFKSGDYGLALNHFNQAHALAARSGQVSATLTYNRAVTFYKLRRYQDAKNDFAALIPPSNAGLTLEQRQWADLGRYNLGLIARDQHQNSIAKNWFTQLQQPDTNARLRELGARQIANLPKDQSAAKTEAVRAKKSSVLFSFSAAQDDNASSLADELSSELSQAEDTYLNLLAYGQHYLSGQRGQGTKLYGLAQVRRYQEFESFNSTVIGGGMGREFTPDKWTYELGGRLLQTQLNNSRLSTQYTVNSRARSTPDQHQGLWEINYQGSFFDAGDTYAYIEGWQQQLQLARVQFIGKVTLTPSLSWETNKRDNHRIEENFYSYSPDILSVALALNWDASRDWRIYSLVNLSKADYSGTNKLTDLGKVEKIQQRHYERKLWQLGTRYRINNQWSIKAEYNSFASDDNFELYSYDKNVFSLKLDYGW